MMLLKTWTPYCSLFGKKVKGYVHSAIQTYIAPMHLKKIVLIQKNVCVYTAPMQTYAVFSILLQSCVTLPSSPSPVCRLPRSTGRVRGSNT